MDAQTFAAGSGPDAEVTHLYFPTGAAGALNTWIANASYFIVGIYGRGTTGFTLLSFDSSVTATTLGTTYFTPRLGMDLFTSTGNAAMLRTRVKIETGRSIYVSSTAFAAVGILLESA